MALFSKNNDSDNPADQAESTASDAESQQTVDAGGELGPFDGDSVEIAEFDFTDFSLGILNLGSLQIPMPKGSQIQVEMGETGPKMLHIVTTFGRLTPVAFAAPKTPGQWEESADAIAETMAADGMNVTREDGPWGPEIVGTINDGCVRILGADGPRWMMRITTAGPADKAAELTELARETMARTFVYRGEHPVPAGNPLPVALPAQLAEQVQQAMVKRAQQTPPGQTPDMRPLRAETTNNPAAAPGSAAEQIKADYDKDNA